MCGDASIGKLYLQAEVNCSGESMFCCSCCPYKILPPFTDTVHEQLSSTFGKTCNSVSTYSYLPSSMTL